MIHRFSAVPAAALFVALATACAAPQPVSPLPVDAEATTTAASEPTPAPSASPTGPSHTRPSPAKQVRTSSACLGAVRFEVGTQEELQPASLCFHVGGVLRVAGAGPGEVRATPTSRTSSNYAGGVTDVRFVGAGTVTVTYPHGGGTWTVTVIVKR
ncbi:hypothetical protein DMB66_21145 [Actinoplanes sp. ATCC 53533]|uniref:hypothetical protein n=1 Tax=Actinoplanes sp. ATCC 53533 TaxID=1288362 RepID=UPI000F7B2374|nr:hypothetical protein [Actinoplanes sp. ATCC 53533]RSM64142.1 hypothetical protein DMB66_21145 [Actinoplanes sp. ATCC 53533]